MMDHTASSTMDLFCTRLTNRIRGPPRLSKYDTVRTSLRTFEITNDFILLKIIIFILFGKLAKLRVLFKALVELVWSPTRLNEATQA